MTKNGSEPTSRASDRCAASDAYAASSSFGVLAVSILSCSPFACAAPCTSRISGAASGLVGLTSMATTDALGTSSPSSSSRFCPSGPVIKVMPVALPPGRLKLVTNPAATGSSPTTKTIGTVVVAVLAASAAGGAAAAMTATERRIRSAAIAGSFSYWPSANRYSIPMFCPSMKPVSVTPCRNEATRCAVRACDKLLRNPITGIARLLRARRQRPRRRAAEKRDELAPLHSITSSARASNLSGIARLNALAVLRLITNSNLVGCMTGRSDGLAPLMIFPAYMPIWRYASDRCVP